MKNANGAAEPESPDRETGPNSLTPFIVLGLIVVVAQLALGIAIFIGLDNWTDRADLGQMFGVASSLFAGLAFAGITYAIFLQKDELELQRQELRLTRGELRRSAEAQERSEELLAKQVDSLTMTATLNSLAIMPLLSCTMTMEGSTVFIETSNVGTMAAFQVEILAVAQYNEDEFELDTFLSEFVKPDYREEARARFTSSDEGFWGVYDVLRYEMFPPRRQLLR